MGDPITAGIQIICSALSAASSVAEYADKSRIRNEQRAERARSVAHQLNPPPATQPSETVQIPGIVETTGFEQWLPVGWEKRKTKECRVYYLDHNTKEVSWTRPASTGPQPIPQGWEMKMMASGRVYYMNHNTETSVWHLPLPRSCTIENIYPFDPDLSPQSENTTPVIRVVDDPLSLEELFLVLGTLGQRLIALGAIVQTALPSSHASVSNSISIIAKGILMRDEELDYNHISYSCWMLNHVNIKDIYK